MIQHVEWIKSILIEIGINRLHILDTHTPTLQMSIRLQGAVLVTASCLVSFDPLPFSAGDSVKLDNLAVPVERKLPQAL